MNEMMKKAAEGLMRRGFEVTLVASKEAATELILREAVSAASVGWGGSETIKALGVRERLAAEGKEIRDHQLVMDLFLLSANALTVDGRIVNIDGRGNRVAASITGPGRVIYVVGRNKIVDGGVDAAIARIRKFACPPNCRRLGKRTPCALTGRCENCDSPDRICRVIAIFERRPTATPTHVILVDEDLGY